MKHVLTFVFITFTIVLVAYVAWLFWNVSSVDDNFLYLFIGYAILSSVMWFKMKQSKGIAGTSSLP